MKLNLGARDTKINGFKNVDIEKFDTVDIVCDIANLKFAKDESVDEIYASHCLEHFPHTKTLDVLKEWCRVLRKGGILNVAVPDFDKVVKIYNKDKMLTEFLINFMYGDQVYDKAFHYTIFNYNNLIYLLSKAGFNNFEKVDKFRYNLDDCSNLIYSMTKENVSLNVVATK